MDPRRLCPECEEPVFVGVNRRQFVQAVGATAAAASIGTLAGPAFAEDQQTPQPETLVKPFDDSLRPRQNDEICFEWDHTEDRGLHRSHVSEGPSSVRRFRGSPHVHVWVNVASDPSVMITPRG